MVREGSPGDAERRQRKDWPDVKRWLTGGIAVALGAVLLAGCDSADIAGPAPDSDRVIVATPPATSPGTHASASPSPSPAAVPTPSTPPHTGPTPTASPETDPAATLHRVLGVIDGDTIDVRIDGQKTRIRVIGIDTPERDECGYQEAASAMQSLVQSRDVRLEADPTQDDEDRYGRLLRHVFTADGVSVAESLIGEGLGREYTYSAPYTHHGDHVAAQTAAQAAGLGVWGGNCGQTSQGSVEDPAAGASGDCTIKGNINREGVRIYHVPGQQHYDKTQIDEADGERWFCSEQEATDAGWRRSKR